MATRTYTETAIKSCDLRQKKVSATVLGFRYGGRTTGTFYISTNFRDRPIGRSLASNYKRDAVTAAHAADPNGAPRLTLCRICYTSASVIESFTQLSYDSGRATGPASIRGPGMDSTQRRALDHRQYSARATMLAQTGYVLARLTQHQLKRGVVSVVVEQRPARVRSVEHVIDHIR